MGWGARNVLVPLLTFSPASGLLSLLHASSGGALNTSPVEPEPSLLGDAFPLEWVRVPKTGLSFVNTLIHMRGACPGLPEALYVSAETMGDYGSTMRAFLKKYQPEKKCNASILDVSEARLWHHGIEHAPRGGFRKGKGRFVTFLRQPEQRVLSWMHFRPNEKREYTLRAHSGEATKMLTRSSPCWMGHPPTRTEVDEAKLRLRTGFAFVGITEKWNLSICLFNAMFKQPCRPYQFSNAHATRTKLASNSSSYDTQTLNGWRDPYDNELYYIGMEMFEANLKKYNVSESSCESCWREAGLLPPGTR